MNEDTTHEGGQPVAGPLQRPVGRLEPKRAGLAAKIEQASALHALVRTLGAKPGSERSANDVSREAALMDAQIEGELWSWVRSVMCQGADIRVDYDMGNHNGYEAYSARLDAAAAERAEELLARLKTPNAEVSGCLRAPMPEDAPRTAAVSPLDRPVGPVAGA